MFHPLCSTLHFAELSDISNNTKAQQWTIQGHKMASDFWRHSHTVIKMNNAIVHCCVFVLSKLQSEFGHKGHMAEYYIQFTSVSFMSNIL